MLNKHRRFAARMAPLLLGLGAAGIAMGASHAGSTNTDEPVACEIQATQADGMIALEGIVRADEAIRGSYRFRVSSAGGSGSSNISQGGRFTAGPDGMTKLGKVMLGNTGAAYDASLEVTSNGVTIECAKRVGGAI